MEAVLAQRKRIRSPVGAGIFYPEDKKEVLDYIRSFNLKDGSGGFAKAFIAPHGAWSYSGALVASAFSSAMGRSNSISRVVVLGPIHDKYEKGLFLSNSHSFQTPLGNIPVDRRISEELEFYSSHMETNDIPHLREHSIEILLPFIKYCFPHASIVPILMGQPESQYIHDLARALKKAITPVLNETLIVVSCNLSSDKDLDKARLLAEESLRLFSEKNASAISSAVLDGKLNACGGALVASLLESGLLDKTRTFYSADKIVSAACENNTVYYSDIYFV